MIVLAAILPSAPLLATEDDPEPGTILAFPSDQDNGFKPHELPFSLPRDSIARAEFFSHSFFAIILKSAGRCSLKEQERLEIQDKFPDNKVFMDRFSCGDDDNLEEYIAYENANPDYSFIAVYGGPEWADAKLLYDQMRVETLYPGANIRQMRAVLNFP